LKKEKNFNNPDNKTRILIAPLDWGLGHATRCIPIIKEFILHGCEVFIVADKKNFSLLKKEFPSTVFLRYPGYEIEYSYSKRFFGLKLLYQFPKVIFKMFKEKKWLCRIIKEHSIDAVISDNRLGMYSGKIPSVYITHQLCIKTGNPLTEAIAQRIHYFFIKKYKYCWVPDSKKNGLAGALSHPKKIPSNVVYIGPLSRFELLSNVEEIYDLLVTISGPEPQRTLFENQILKQLNTFSGTVFLIRGLPSESVVPAAFEGSIKTENHLPANELNKIIAQSKMIISRSGYTSVMDFALMKKKAILIPTPGQTEQEYLAKYLLEKGYFLSTKQKDLSIKNALEICESFSFKTIDPCDEKYKKVISEFVLSLKSGNFATQ
jgi:uncharacterized protein (TIGR00661 family)